MKLFNRLLLLVAFVASTGVSSWAILEARSRSRPASRAVTPALLHLPRLTPALLSSESVLSSDSEYHEYLKNQMVLIHSPIVLKSCLRDPNVLAHGLTAERIREGLKTQLIPDSELMTILFESPDPKIAVDVTNAVVDAFMSVCVESEKRDFLDRMDKLRVVWEDSARRIVTKRKQVDTSSGDLTTSLPGVVDVLKRSYIDHFNAMEQLRVRKESLARQPRTAESDRELEAVSAEIEDRAERLKAISRVLKRGSDEILDHALDEEEPRLPLEIFRKVGEEIERLETRLHAPERVRAINRAEIETE